MHRQGKMDGTCSSIEERGSRGPSSRLGDCRGLVSPLAPWTCRLSNGLAMLAISGLTA